MKESGVFDFSSKKKIRPGGEWRGSDTAGSVVIPSPLPYGYIHGAEMEIFGLTQGERLKGRSIRGSLRAGGEARRRRSCCRDFSVNVGAVFDAD
jgi:hypothetical protein